MARRHPGKQDRGLQPLGGRDAAHARAEHGQETSLERDRQVNILKITPPVFQKTEAVPLAVDKLPGQLDQTGRLVPGGREGAGKLYEDQGQKMVRHRQVPEAHRELRKESCQKPGD
jgi:hypothetical protein